MTKIFQIEVISFHGNDIYHNIVIFAFNKVFMISEFVILYEFHNSYQQCQNITKKLKLTEDK